jgi:hypothetical protein
LGANFFRDVDEPMETLEQLGNAIKAMVRKSDDYLISAGLKLVEARKRIAAERITWAAFLDQHCGGLSRSRANELIRIGEGKTTVEAMRERARQGMAASRERARAASVRNVTDTPREPLGPHRAADGPRPNRLVAALRAFDALDAVERAQFLAVRGLVEVDAEVEFDDAA